jgi:hypothetical protein
MQPQLGPYKYEDLTAFTAVVVVPYQCSIMSVFEYYRLGIPMIVPSLDLLTAWHMDWRCGTALSFSLSLSMPTHATQC